MIRSAIKLGIFLVIGIVGYNYAFGDEEEKAKAKTTIQKAKKAGKALGGALLDLGKDGIALLKEERAKFKEGKYDQAMDKVSGLFSKVKDTVGKGGGALLDKIGDLEIRKDEIAKKIKDAQDAGGLTDEQKEVLTDQFNDLTNDAEKLLKETEKN